jgi:hypothetical protein
MEYRCWPKLLILFIFLAVNIISFSQESLIVKSDSIACDTFPPPRNLDGFFGNSNLIYLYWQPPLIPDSAGTFVPANITQFNVYHNSVLVDSVLGPWQDTVWYVDTIDIWYPPEVISQIKEKLLSHFSRNETLTVAEFKDLLNVSRKHAVGLLEYFDGLHLTRRIENHRILHHNQ